MGIVTPAQFARRKVSLQKRRYQENGYDLDLAYVTDRVIAMGFPSQGVEAYLRNPMSQVKKFLEQFHADHYKVYNLCIERSYDLSKHFHDRGNKYGFFDHQAPPAHLIGEFCADVQAWLDADPKNVAAIHCKAGKGRAGMMTCCYLMHSGLKPGAQEAQDFFAMKRTKNNEGVTIPSQKVFIGYYHDILNHGPVPPAEAPKPKKKKSSKKGKGGKSAKGGSKKGGSKGKGKGKGKEEESSSSSSSDSDSNSDSDSGADANGSPLGIGGVVDPSPLLEEITLESVQVRVSQFSEAHKRKTGGKARLRVGVYSNDFAQPASREAPVPELEVLFDPETDCKALEVADVDNLPAEGKKSKRKTAKTSGFVTIPIGLKIRGDIKIKLFDDEFNAKKDFGHLYFNTFFIEDDTYTVGKAGIDDVWKNKGFTDDFSVSLKFTGASPGGMQRRKAAGYTVPHPAAPDPDSLAKEIDDTRDQVEAAHEDVAALEDELISLDKQVAAAKKKSSKTTSGTSKKGKGGGSSASKKGSAKGGDAAAAAAADSSKKGGKKGGKGGDDKPKKAAAGKTEKKADDSKPAKTDKAADKGAKKSSSKKDAAEASPKGKKKAADKKPADKKEDKKPAAKKEDKKADDKKEEASASSSSSSSSSSDHDDDDDKDDKSKSKSASASASSDKSASSSSDDEAAASKSKSKSKSGSDDSGSSSDSDSSSSDSE